MNIENWRNGIKLCLVNVIDIYREAQLLLKNKRYTRGCFLLITAFEELATVYYIMGNFNEPKPEFLQDLKNHRKKLSIASFLTFPINSNYKLLKNYINKFKKLNLKDFNLKVDSTDDLSKSDWFKFGNEIQIAKSLMTIRNYCLYTNLNLDSSDFVNPRKISQELIINVANDLYFILTITIPSIQIQIKKLFKSQNPMKAILKFEKEDFEILELTSEIYMIISMIQNKSIEKIKSSNKYSKKLKTLAIQVILNPEIDKDLKFGKTFIIELFKPIASKYSEIIKSNKKKEEINLLIKVVLKYDSLIGETLKKFFNLLLLISEEKEIEIDKFLSKGFIDFKKDQFK